jgi:predicted outer membrane repeat protein
MGARRLGLVWLAALVIGVAAPASASAATTIFPNTFLDPAPGAAASVCNNTSNTDTSSPCSLRDAIIKADSGEDGTDPTISLAAGTYEIQRAPTTDAENDPFNNQNGEFDISTNLTIEGQGPGQTTVEGGTSAPGISLIFLIDPYFCSPSIVTSQCLFADGVPLDVTLSGMTMQFGHNVFDALTWGDGGAVEYDSSDGGQLTLSNDVITQNSTSDGDGGGVALFDDARNNADFTAVTSTSSRVTITDTTISDNTANSANVGEDTSGNDNGAGGGGIFDGSEEPLVMSNDTVTGNVANDGSACTGCSAGGGIDAPGQGLIEFVPGATVSSITNTTISDNTASQAGGGMINTQPLTITGSTFSGNKATINTTEGGEPDQGTGGGWWGAIDQGLTDTVTDTSFTDNSAPGDGGGILWGSATLNITDSRFAGNSASAGTGLFEPSNNVVGVVDATDDWWGCNTGPAAAPCDTAVGQDTFTGSSFTDSPWVEVRTNADPTTVQAGAARR